MCFTFINILEIFPNFTFLVDNIAISKNTLKSLINVQGGYVVFLVLSEYSFIRDFRVLAKTPST